MLAGLVAAHRTNLPSSGLPPSLWWPSVPTIIP